MGQGRSDSLPEQSISQSTQSHLERRFFVSAHPVYVNNPDFKLLHEKLTNKKYILRIMTMSDQSERAKLEESILKKIASKNQYLPKLEHYIFQEYKGYCGRVVKCYLFFELGEFTTLREEILKQGHQRAPFTEGELLKGMQSLVFGLLWLRFFREQHGNINSLNIYYRKGEMILSDPLIAPANNQNPERYISPEKQLKMDNKLQDYDGYVSDVFAIAMCMLQALKLGYMDKIYKKNDKLNSGLLIEEVSKIKGEKIRQLLQRLLVSASNAEHRQIFLDSVSKRYNQSLVVSRIGSENNRKIHSIGAGKKANLKESDIEGNFITAAEVNKLEFKKDNSVPILDIMKPGSNNIEKSQFIYKMNSQIQRPIAPTYKPFESLSYQGSYQFNPPSLISAPSVNFTTLGTSNNYVKPFVRNNQAEKLIPTLQSLATPSKLQVPTAPISSYFPLSHQFSSFDSKFSNVSRKLEYPKQIKPAVSTSIYSVAPTPSSSIFNEKKETKYDGQYRNRWMLEANETKKVDVPVINLKEHSFPKRISSLKKYSEDYRYQKYLEGYDSNKKSDKKEVKATQYQTSKAKDGQNTLKYFSKNREWSSKKKEEKLEGNSSLTQQGQRDLAVNKMNSLKKGKRQSAEKQGQKEQGKLSRGKVSPSPIKQEEGNKQNGLSLKSKREIIKAEVDDKGLEQNLQIKRSNRFAKNSQKLQQCPVVGSNKKTESEYSAGQSRKIENQESHSSGASGQFQTIISKNIYHLQQGISEAIGKSIKSIAGQSANTRSNEVADQSMEESKVESKLIESQFDQKQDNAPLIISQVVGSEGRTSEVVSETVIEQNGVSHPKGDERQTRRDDLTVKNSINYENRRDEQPTSPKTSLRPYEPNIRHRHNITIPEEDAFEEESLQEGASSSAQQKGQYKEEVYENGGKYCGFVLNNERNGEGTFYYKDGGYYEGHWKKNAMNGFGRLYYDNGSLAYEGQWYEDEFHGRGKVFNDSAADLIGPFDYKTFSDYEQYWTLYDGDLSHDNKQGHGKLLFSNNQFYTGQFCDDLPHGEGYYHTADRIIHGIWNKGSLVKII